MSEMYGAATVGHVFVLVTVLLHFPLPGLTPKVRAVIEMG